MTSNPHFNGSVRDVAKEKFSRVCFSQVSFLTRFFLQNPSCLCYNSRVFELVVRSFSTTEINWQLVLNDIPVLSLS